MTSKKWKSLTAAQKRVAIARDVLLQIRLRYFEVRTGDYISYNRRVSRVITARRNKTDSDVHSVQELLPTLKKSCTACARGAIVLSACRIDGDARISFFESITGNSGSASNDDVRSASARMFGARQACLIEAAFEVSFSFAPEYGDDAAFAEQFGRRYRSSRTRLIAIMKDIVENKGVFNPRKAEQEREKLI